MAWTWCRGDYQSGTLLDTRGCRQHQAKSCLDPDNERIISVPFRFRLKHKVFFFNFICVMVFLLKILAQFGDIFNFRLDN